MCRPFTRFRTAYSWSGWIGHSIAGTSKNPYYEIRFAVLKPRHLTGCFMTGRLYCTPRAMWKLSWFLRDFGYDSELLEKNAIDEQALVGLWGVVKVSEISVHGISLLNFDGFAPAARWEELSVFTDSDPGLRGSVEYLEQMSWPEGVRCAVCG